MKKLSLICAVAVVSSAVVIPEADAHRFACGMASKNSRTYGKVALVRNQWTKRAAVLRAKSRLRYPRAWRSWSRYKYCAVASGNYWSSYTGNYYMKRGYAWGWRSQSSAQYKALSYIPYYYNGQSWVERYAWALRSGWNNRRH